MQAYSEMMPSPWIGWRPYGKDHAAPRNPEDPFAWTVNEREQAFELGPGLQLIASQVLPALQRLDGKKPARGISRANLENNVYWPKELAGLPGAIPHERYVTILPLALSKAQDDKGRVRWMFYGSSEQGPDRSFWKSFYNAPGRERRPEYAVDFVRRLLRSAYGEKLEQLTDLRRAGFRIIPGSGEKVCRAWRQDPLPSWTEPFLLRDRESLRGIKYVLTFRPFGTLPQAVRRAYLAGDLHLLPYPGSLIFWGVPSFLNMQSEFRLAMQIPLLNVCARHEAPRGLRILQSGWLIERRAGMPETEKLRERQPTTYRRTNRWERIEQYEDELAAAGDEVGLTQALFSTDPDAIGLYGKPMARNSQIWTDRFRLLLDGPHASRQELRSAAKAVREGGRFGYRIYYPPMRVGKYEVFWHMPLVSFIDPETRKPKVLDDAPLGYLTACDTDKPDLSEPVELWPELLRRYRRSGHRSKDGTTIPDIARHPHLRGEIRLPGDMRSSLFNTDGQIFSDAGIPVVLFMENYDINRVGYHDINDNMSNIDLDYGAAVAAIAIESVARAAASPMPSS